MISIIIPVYNASSHLDKCIKSVIEQTYQDWECILVDDGSTDESYMICNAWKKKDFRIRVFRQKNTGVSSARNKGIDNARGEYITFVDSDDWIENEYLEELYNKIKKVDIVVCGQIRDYDDGRSIEDCPSTDCVFSINPQSSEVFVELNKKTLLFGPVIKLYLTRIIREHEIKFPVSVSYGEDLIFNYTYLNYVNTIGCICKCLYHYRMTDYSLSRRVRIDMFDVDYNQWRILYAFFYKRGILNECTEKYLYCRLWGILYDSIFLTPYITKNKLEYLKKILQVPEISKLKDYQSFKTSSWIKWAIIKRQYLFFYGYFVFNR